MPTKVTPWSISRTLILATVLALSAQYATAAVANWKGPTPNAKTANDAEVRLSILGFTDPDKAKAVVAQYQQYLENHNTEELQKFLQQQDTKGYVFTTEAVGYSIKYAWQDNDKHLVLLVTPALLTHNPYQWKQPNQNPDPFTLLELKVTGDEATASSSLDTPIEVNAQGQLQLKAGEKSKVFAQMKDDTPYYLKGK